MYYHTDSDLFVQITRRAEFQKEKRESYHKKLLSLAKLQDSAAEILQLLSTLSTDDALATRDFFDIARTVLGRYLNAAILCCQVLYTDGAPIECLQAAMQAAERLMERMVELLGAHEDYSLFHTLSRLETVSQVGAGFARVLKNNAACDYCRSYIYENAKYLYLPEMHCLFDEVNAAATEGREIDRTAIKRTATQIKASFLESPLSKQEEATRPLIDILADAARDVAALQLC